MKKTLLILMVALCLCSNAFGYLVQKQITFAEEFKDFSLVRSDIAWVKVYNAGTDTAATIYADRSGTNAITQPITDSSTNTTLYPNEGRVYFYDRAGSHDIEASVGGVIIRIDGLTSSETRIEVPKHLTASAVTQKGGFVKFGEQPVCVQEDGTAASGVDTEVNVAATGGLVFEYSNIGTQTILVPNIAATGLDIARDQTADDGTEYNQGILASSPAAFTVGTDGPFHFKVKYSIADVSGTDDCAIGFRNDGAYAPAIDNYTDMAALNVISGDIYIETILNSGATTSTDTTDNWADAASHTLEVYVSMAGVVTYKIDGDAPSTTAAFTFDSGDVVVPFFYFLHDTDLAGAVVINKWDCGLDD